jgi:UDP-GlcNAc:undecaprenyl-phosphate GlcNAc-1-phosphate transferase
LTPVFRRIALRTQFLDNPTGQLKKHTAPVPYLGGLAVYFAFLMVILGVTILAPPPDSSKLLALLAGGTVLALMGLWDDLFSLGPGFKFVVQFLAAGLLVLFGVRLEFMPSYPILGVVLTIFWVVAVTNAINLVDIMDGLAGSLIVVACLGFIVVSLPGEQTYVNIAAAVLGGALLGFLPYNWRPARIYLGDTGALLAGFVLAGVAMGQRYTEVNNLGLLAPFFILGIPLYDTLLVIVLRLLKRRSPFLGSNDHVALRLRALGLSVPMTAGILATVGVLLSLSAWWLVRMSDKRAAIFLIAVFAIGLVVTLFISQIQMDAPQKVNGDPKVLFPKQPVKPVLRKPTRKTARDKKR